MSGVRSTFLPAPVAPPALPRCEIYTYTYVPMLVFASWSRLALSLFLSLSLSLSLYFFPSLLIFLSRYFCGRYITSSESYSYSSFPLSRPAIRIGEVPAPLHEITSLPLDFTSGENTPVSIAGNLRCPSFTVAFFPPLLGINFRAITNSR